MLIANNFRNDETGITYFVSEHLISGSRDNKPKWREWTRDWSHIFAPEKVELIYLLEKGMKFLEFRLAS